MKVSMKSGILQSTGIVAMSTLVSRIMGFVRDMIIANFFGASAALDGFFVAFRIPNLLRRLVAEGALTVSFIPVYTEYMMKEGREEALRLAQKTLTVLTVILASFVLLGVIFSPQIVRVFAYGFSDTSLLSLTTSLNRVMFPYLFMVGIVAFCMGYLNSHKYFFAPAFSPVLLNVGFITGAVWFSTFFDEPLYGLAAGVLAGGTLQLILQVPYMLKAGFKLKLSFDLAHPGIRRIFRLIVPMLFGVAVYQINILLNTVLASMLPRGSISYLYYSDRLNEVVLGVFIVSIGNVILPELSRFTATDDNTSLKRLYTQAMRAALFLAVPSSMALMMIGKAVISVLFMRGEFTAVETEMTYLALLFSSLGIASISMLRITTPTFFSLKDTRAPVITSAIALVLNVSLGYVLMQTHLLHGGLALANTIAVTVQMLILFVWLQKKVGRLKLQEIIIPFGKYLVAGGIMCAAIFPLYNSVNWLADPFAKRLGYLVVMVGLGGLVYFAACYLLGVEELKKAMGRIGERIGR